MYLEEHVQCINEKLLCLRDKHNIVIWGGAENTAKLFQYTDILNYDIGGIVDKGRAGNQFYGRQLQSPADMEWTQIEAVVISSFHYEDEIEEELKNKFHFAGLIIKLKEQGQIIPFYHHCQRRIFRRRKIIGNYWNEIKDSKVFIRMNGFLYCAAALPFGKWILRY